MSGRVHPFQYFTSSADVRIFERRDAAASFEVQRALVEQGFQLGESLLNYPSLDAPAGGELLQVDTTGVARGDLILLTTRPPKNDLEQGHRKRVPMGCTDIEDYIFQAVGVYLDTCARSVVTLSAACAERLAPEWKSFASMEFKQPAPGVLVRHRAHSVNPRARNPWFTKPRDTRETLVFLVRTESLWVGGPGLLAAFGMSGETTLAWAYRLGHDLAHLLEGPRFVMAKMTFGGVPARHTQSSWAANLPLEIILDLAGPDAALDYALDGHPTVPGIYPCSH